MVPFLAVMSFGDIEASTRCHAVSSLSGRPVDCRPVGRWEPGAAGRLRAAALELFVERGFEQTTVADIAERAGLTARTFFRYFADKREVLFAGSAELQQAMADAVTAAPAGASPLDAVAAGLVAVGEILGHNRDFSRQRQAVVSANAELRERELIKLDTLSAALAAALRDRDVPEPDATLAAETGVLVFKQGFVRWVADGEQRPLATLMTDLLNHLRALTAVT